MVAHRAGYGIVPSRVVKQYEESKLEKVKDSPVFNDRICLVYKNEFRKLKRGQIFIEAVKKSIA
jgi:DNA-binding transcriptional LysR family regulator